MPGGSHSIFSPTTTAATATTTTTTTTRDKLTMDAKLNNLCGQKLSDFKIEDGYITGYLEGDYEEFLKLLNTQCSGFATRQGILA